MAIADDLSVAVNGDIRWTGTTATYTVLELHRFLQDLADDAVASGDDLVDITSDTPSDRSTDNIITLLGSYNIDDEVAEHLFDGSVTQASGATVYSGLRVLGAVNNANTQLVVIQNNKLYPFTTTPAAPFWGDQSSGGLNGNSAAGILMRCLIKSRENDADIDGKRIRVQARHWGDTYDFFSVTLGQGESVAAISTTPDAQNDTLQATVTTYTHVTNSGGTANAPTGGYQQIDLNNGNGNRDYYSAWTYGADTSGDGLKGLWEYIKDLSGNGSAKTIDSINGELFLGITHEVDYDNEASGPFQEREILAWGVNLTYDALAGGTFAVGNRVVFSGGSGGIIMYDNGTTNMRVLLDEGAATPADDETFTEYDDSGASGVTATVNGTPTGSGGGNALVLALDDNGATGTMWIQLLRGTAPADNDPLIGSTSAATADVNTTPVARTVPKIFLGSYTGSLIGAYGVGVDADDLTASDTIEDLTATTQTPPNNVTFTVTGLVSGEDRVLVGPRSAGILQKDQFGLNTTLNGAAETSIVQDAPIPADTPSAGDIRVQLDTGVFREQPYTSYTGSTYTIPSTDYSGGNVATAANDLFIAYIDELASGATASFTAIYSTDRDLFVRVRDGGGTPIKTFEVPATLTSAGGSVAAVRTTDA